MKKTASALLVALLTTLTAPAANIAWVSFHAGDNTPTTAAANLGYTQAPDVGYTSLLAANGHTVTRFVTKNDPTAADATYLNSFDLIIVGRSVDSANYQQANETLFWNSTIIKPVILMGGYVLRNSRLGYTSGATIPDVSSAQIALSVVSPSHPIFAGIPLDGANLMVNPYAQLVTTAPTAVNQRGISVNTDPLVGGGSILARVGTAGDAAVNGMIIGEWAWGSTLPNGNKLGNERLVFLSGSREQATGGSSQQAGMYDLIGDGPQMFLNAVNYMSVIPEPSTIGFLAVGGLALLLRRGKA